MKQIVTFSIFTDAFRAHDRKDQFSYEGLKVLFDWFEELDECNAGSQETELDVIAICCEFSEDTWQEVAENYSVELADCDDDEDRERAVMDHLQNHTMICGTTNGTIIYQDF